MKKRKKKIITIIDDDEVLLEELKETFSTNGFISVAFSDGRNAVQKIKDIQPDLLLLDLRLKKMNGFQIADHLKRDPKTSQIPILAMTGVYTAKEHSLLMKACGIQKCLNKPFDPQDILSEVYRILNKK